MSPHTHHSSRSSVYAQNVVATSQPLAAQAGLEIIRKGGNAIDAAIATAITLTVVEPTSNGIGSDAFCIVWDGKKIHGLNASGRSPKSWTPGRFARLKKMPNLGWQSVTVPGAVDAWAKLSERFGKLPFAKLFEPAIYYAENGFTVTRNTAKAWAKAPETYQGFNEFGDAFLPDGKAPKEGQTFRNPNQAKTLKSIADSKGKSFYTGEIADQIVKHAQLTNGDLTREDLAEHESKWVTPLNLRYGKYQLHELPPNGQGITALIALGILKEFKLDRFTHDAPTATHLQIEAMKAAFKETYTHVGDSEYMNIIPSDLINKFVLEKQAGKISESTASSPQEQIPQSKGTVYLTTADDEGRMVSFIQSNYGGFGSGIVIPNTGISMQNRGSGFVINPNHPNNVGPGKRPFHTIMPAFVTKADTPIMSFGVMGGPMQPQGHLQVFLRILEFGQTPQEASDTPRWRITKKGIAFETGFDPEIIKNLQQRGHPVIEDAPPQWFGGAQIILKQNDTYAAASDHRKDGQAAGY